MKLLSNFMVIVCLIVYGKFDQSALVRIKCKKIWNQHELNKYYMATNFSEYFRYPQVNNKVLTVNTAIKPELFL